MKAIDGLKTQIDQFEGELESICQTKEIKEIKEILTKEKIYQ